MANNSYLLKYERNCDNISMKSTAFTQEVPQTLLISYKGNGYSVPAKYIGKRVKIYPIGQKLYIYFNTELISIHEISNKKFNYHKEDYSI